MSKIYRLKTENVLGVRFEDITGATHLAKIRAIINNVTPWRTVVTDIMDLVEDMWQHNLDNRWIEIDHNDQDYAHECLFNGPPPTINGPLYTLTEVKRWTYLYGEMVEEIHAQPGEKSINEAIPVYEDDTFW